MTEFFPVLDAIDVNRVALRRFVKNAPFDLFNTFIANEDTYCINCNTTIEKYTPCEAYFSKGRMIRVLCIQCAKRRKRKVKK